MQKVYRLRTAIFCISITLIVLDANGNASRLHILQPEPRICDVIESDNVRETT